MTALQTFWHVKNCCIDDCWCPCYHRTQRTRLLLLQICWRLDFFAIVFGLKSHNIPSLKNRRNELPLWGNTSWLSFRQLSTSRHGKMKCFERQLEEQLWFVTMIPTTYTPSYLNAFQTVLQMCSVPPSITGKCMGLADIDELKALTFRTEG